ncbi:MAG TPA: 1,4-alpha-glucan branching protein GlgB [Burkholderiales bacterium]|nr:1,4-alpha-glucan branching protein GlgB [Burkholderiales bacterium]
MTPPSSAPSGVPVQADPLVEALLAARLHDPFSLLGLHRVGERWRLRVFNPHAEAVWLRLPSGLEPLDPVHPAGLFEWRGAEPPAMPYVLGVSAGGEVREMHDPYAFVPALSGHDLYLFNEGRLRQAWSTLGSHPEERHGVQGVRFAVWAPNAERVSVIGDLNRWDGRVHPMAAHGSSGVWELFIPGLRGGELYKYEIRNRASGEVLVKTDPYAQEYERRPGTAARVRGAAPYRWQDAAWLERRAQWDWQHAPMSIYEVHLGSWKRHPDGRFHSYRELAGELVAYVRDMGYTHVELLPVSEHPLDESWGYQTTGYFAATTRYGSPDDLRALIDAFHQAGIGVFVDWVPAHFPQDAWALARFDGTALFEHEDPRLGLHQDWGTHIFNYGRNEVRSFLLSSAHYWLSEFHADGLRVDAVASMLYLDYSRLPGEWLPNKYGGRENLEAIEFLRALNVMVHEQFPGALTLAEESTAWPMVSRPAWLGGLGFSLKWNMGWMNDTLSYMRLDPIHRRYHHDQLTFGQLYAYTENFLLPLSHDEVVHGKGSLLDKMPGDTWREFANLRLLFVYQYTAPGKKLNFMGNEIAQGREWQARWELDWSLLAIDWHAGVQRLTRDLNRLHRESPALHDQDFAQEGFSWIDCHDSDHSTLSFLRRARDGSFVVVVFNFTPVPRQEYRIGLPTGGRYEEILNSDSAYYGGSNAGNAGGVQAEALPWMGLAFSAAITLPPLAGIVLRAEPR